MANCTDPIMRPHSRHIRPLTCLQVLTGEAAGLKVHPALVAMFRTPVLSSSVAATEATTLNSDSCLIANIKQSLSQPGPRGLLNERQQAAVLAVLAPKGPVQIVRGPPGTGEWWK